MSEPSRALLEARNLRPKKSFGQNFLLDEHHLDAIFVQVRALAPKGIVELGAGAGALTERLLQLGPVTAIERDRDLVPVLRERFAERPLTLVEADAVRAPYDAPEPFALVGNLPYHLTSQLLFRARDEGPRLAGAVFLTQLEVCDRVTSPPGEKRYGILSVLLQARFTCERVHVIPRGAFWPVPDVDGGVIRMVPKANPFSDAEDEARFIVCVKHAFSQRRKTIRNTVGKRWPGALEAADIDERARPEALSVEDFIRLGRATGGRGA